MSGDIKLGITFTGDSSGLVGEAKVSKKSLEELAAGGKKAGDTLAAGLDKATRASAQLTAAQAHLSRKTSAYEALQSRSNHTIQREISRTRAAYKRLAADGTLSAGELSRAYKITQQRVAGLRREMAGLSTSGRGVSTLTSKVIALGSAYLSVQGIMKAIGSSDTFTSVNARLLNATKTAEEFGIAQRETAAIARETRSSWEGTVDLYSRLSRATQDLDVKQSDLLLVTKALNQAGIVSGATTIEQSNAMIQLGQGLASGTLRGDELRSVLEQVPRVARLISDGMGIAFGDIRKLAEDGKITTEQIVKAIVKESATVQAEFDRMPPTISQALGQIGNEFTKLIGTQATASGGASALAGALLDVADNVKQIPQYLPEIAFGLAAVATQFIAGKVAAVGFAGSVVAAKVAVAGLLRTMLPLAAALAVFETGKTALEAYSAGQDAAAGKTRETAMAIKLYAEKLVPAREQLRALGIDISKIKSNNIEQVTAALHALNVESSKSRPVAANDDTIKPKRIAPIDPKLVAKSLKQAQALTAQLETAFDDTFTRTTNKYVATWQQLVRTHGEGSAQVKQLESAFQSWLDASAEHKAAKDKEQSDKVIGLQTEKYIRLNQMAAEAVATDEERAQIKLKADLQTMADERQRLIDQKIWTDELEQQYDQARIDRAQITAVKIQNIKKAEAEASLAIEARHTSIATGMKKQLASNAIGFLRQMGQSSKAFQTAAIIAEAAYGAASIFVSSQMAAAAALAPPPLGLGPIAGAPLAGTISALGAANAALVVGSAVGRLTSGGGGSTSTLPTASGPALSSSSPGAGPSIQPTQPQQQPERTTVVYVNVNGVTTQEVIDQTLNDVLPDRVNNADFTFIDPQSAQGRLLKAAA